MDPLTAGLVGGAVIGAGSSLVGGHMADRSSQAAASKNAQLQKQFAQKGIQWKVADAKAAGILPEFALGASTHSFSPTYTGGQQGNMVADAGQNIARAALATATAPDRKTDELLKAETLRGMKLDNDIKQTQMTRVNAPGNPPFPHPRGNVIEGQGNSPVRDVPLERVGQSRTARHSEGASIPSVGWMETADGGLRPVPSQDVKNRIEDQLIPEVTWAAQNLIAPNFGKGPKPPADALPRGKQWHWSKSRQAWYAKAKSPRNFGDAAYEYYEKNIKSRRIDRRQFMK